jgi:lysophospholipase L1-like esterase
MQRFERDVLAHNPDFVLLEFGGNNSDPNDRKRRVSLQEAGLCFEEVKKRLSEKTQIALITFPPVIDRQHAFYGHEFFEANGGLNANLELYRNLTREFAEDNGYPLIDFYRHLKIKMEADGENVYTLSDGVHLTETGNRELAELVFITLNKLLKQEE